MVAEAGGTRLTMQETPVAASSKWLHNPVTDALLIRRNAESLARLTVLVERHTGPNADPPPH